MEVFDGYGTVRPGGDLCFDGIAFVIDFGSVRTVDVLPCRDLEGCPRKLPGLIGEVPAVPSGQDFPFFDDGKVSQLLLVGDFQGGGLSCLDL